MTKMFFKKKYVSWIYLLSFQNIRDYVSKSYVIFVVNCTMFFLLSWNIHGLMIFLILLTCKKVILEVSNSCSFWKCFAWIQICSVRIDYTLLLIQCCSLRCWWNQKNQRIDYFSIKTIICSIWLVFCQI